MFQRVTSKFNARILVAEDYALNQDLVVKILEKMECEVEVAEDGEEALEIWEESDFDLIFMDIQMPVYDGYEVTRRIREAEKKESKKRIPIIALTANALGDDREKCLKAGMDDYIAKPFSGADIERILKKYLT